MSPAAIHGRPPLFTRKSPPGLVHVYVSVAICVRQWCIANSFIQLGHIEWHLTASMCPGKTWISLLQPVFLLLALCSLASAINPETELLRQASAKQKVLRWLLIENTWGLSKNHYMQVQFQPAPSSLPATLSGRLGLDRHLHQHSLHSDREYIQQIVRLGSVHLHHRRREVRKNLSTYATGQNSKFAFLFACGLLNY